MTLDNAPTLPEPSAVSRWPLAVGIFRIFQEMLSNVSRHAPASTGSLAICAHAQALHISVADNSKGASASAFDAVNADGVMGMHERVRHVGGTLEISSQISLRSRSSMHIAL